jgi:phage repressor protein C with HTH and peptisase S24 domain
MTRNYFCGNPELTENRVKTMTILGNAIESRRRELQMTQTELARASGQDQRAISKLEIGLTIKPNNWRAIADALNMPHAEMESLIDRTALAAGKPSKMANRRIPPGVAANIRAINYAAMQRTPILGRASAGEPERLAMMHTEYDTIPTPPELAGVEGAYAVYVYGDSVSPRFNAGDLLLVHPHKPVQRGDFCVVQIGSGDDYCGYVKRFVSMDADRLVLHQLNPESDISFPVSDVSAVHKVVGARFG